MVSWYAPGKIGATIGTAFGLLGDIYETTQYNIRDNLPEMVSVAFFSVLVATSLISYAINDSA